MGDGWEKPLDLGITLLELRWCDCGRFFDDMSKIGLEFKLKQVTVLFLMRGGFYGRLGFILENHLKGNVQSKSC